MSCDPATKFHTWALFGTPCPLGLYASISMPVPIGAKRKLWWMSGGRLGLRAMARYIAFLWGITSAVIRSRWTT